MNRFTFTLLLSIALSAVSAQAPADWKEMNLKGKVRSVTVKQNYRYKKNGVAFTPWEKQYTTVYRFNAQGYYSEYQQLFANDSQSYRVSYSYDWKAKTGEQAYFGRNNKPTIKKAIVYNDKGKLTELVEYSNEGVKGRRYQYNYDAKGNNTELIYYNEAGDVGSKTSWLYDAKGNKTDMTVETPGYADSFKKYIYDTKGNITEESWYDGKKQLTFRFVRSYDEKNNLVEETTIKGNSAQANKTSWTYEYDKQGNWIKKTQYSSEGVDFNVEERVIVYY